MSMLQLQKHATTIWNLLQVVTKEPVHMQATALSILSLHVKFLFFIRTLSFILKTKRWIINPKIIIFG